MDFLRNAYDAMNLEKLKKLQEEVRVGGKGTPRRKKKVVKKTTASAYSNHKKVKEAIEKNVPFPLKTIQDIDGVEIVKDDGSLTFISNPKLDVGCNSKFSLCTVFGSAGNNLEFAPRDVPKHPFVKWKEVEEADNIRPPSPDLEEANRERVVVENDDPRRRYVYSRFLLTMAKESFYIIGVVKQRRRRIFRRWKPPWVKDTQILQKSPVLEQFSLCTIIWLELTTLSGNWTRTRDVWKVKKGPRHYSKL